MEYTPKHLVMVTSNNNNKYYDMIPNGDNTWTAKYGRIEGGCQTRTYSFSDWNKKYSEKINKGYSDMTELVTDLIQVEKKKNNEYKSITNQNIANIVERLQKMAREVISENYSVSSNKVTTAMIDEAQNVITSLISATDVKEFNDILLRLFRVIPRKMKNVSDHLVNSKDDFGEKIQNEQDLLDVMKGQVVQKQIVDEVVDEETINEKTILETLGLVFEECDDNDINIIKKQLGECSDKFHQAWKVTNISTQKKYDDFVRDNKIKNTKLLFHGSRNENWWSIIQSGLVLRPTNVITNGKLYGMGTYFAPKAKKSLGYTSLSGSYWAKGNSSSGFMALMDVAYGMPYDVYDFNSKYYNLNYDRLQDFKKGANCLHAHAGANLGNSSLRNDEIVIYKEEQCTIKYLIELK